MASTYIYRTLGTPTSANKGTVSHWIKRGAVGVNEGSYGTFGSFNNGGSATDRGHLNIYNDTIYFYNQQTSTVLQTNRKFKDVNGWYHIVIAWDTTQATASNRVKIYVNGEQETSFSTATYPGQNNTMEFNVSGRRFCVGALGSNGNAAYFWDGSISHFHFCDGYTYAASDFGSTDSTTGEWKINTSPSVSYGNNGFFWLKDSIATTDHSPNSNTFTVGAGTLTKTEDCPSNVFATNNNLWKQESSRYLTHTKGNTMISGGGSATWYQTPATLAFNSGKFYWECKFNASTNLDKNTVGVIDYEKTQESGQFQDKTGSVFFKNEDGGDYRLDASTVNSNWGTLAQNDILGVAVDMDAATPTVKFYKNDALLGTVNASSLSGKFVTPAHMIYTSGEYQVNYGNGYFGTTAVSNAGTNASGIGIFEYDVPTGYTALSTKGLNE